MMRPIPSVNATTGNRPTSRARPRSPATSAPSTRSQAAAYAIGFQGPQVRASTGKAEVMGSRLSAPRSSPNPPGSPPVAPASQETGSRSRLSVVVRKRPMNAKEKATGQQDVVMCRGNAVIVREPKLKVDLTRYIEEHNFLFDQAFDETATNERLYCSCVRPVIDAVFKKAKCTCFAYGQTGSGKTFTMMGPPKGQSEKDKTPGIFLLAAQDIFRCLNSKEHSHLGVYIAFYEIYCGKLFDLLNNRQLLHARENAKSNVVIVGLQEHLVENVTELMEVIEYGLTSRTTGVTGANVDSSRSHAILQVCLRDVRSKEEGGKLQEHGKISFIDLAGSERGADTLDIDRQTRMDGAEINKSLLALKECIRALDQQLDHTPFRGSKLTQVLKDSFVGSNCRTVMIANVSPCSGTVEHSLNTLRYAYRVKELRRSPQTVSTGPGAEAGGAPLMEEAQAREGELVLEEASDGAENCEADSPRPAPPQHMREAPSQRSSAEDDRVFHPVMQPEVAHHFAEATVVAQPCRSPEARSRTEEREVYSRTAAPQVEIAPEVALEPVRCSQAELDELAKQHDRLISTILAEEEELISAHRSHIDGMVELVKEEMVHLNNVDRPGSDVDAYVAGLDRILQLKAQLINDIRQRLDIFKDHLSQEDALSRKFQQLASSSSTES